MNAHVPQTLVSYMVSYFLLIFQLIIKVQGIIMFNLSISGCTTCKFIFISNSEENKIWIKKILDHWNDIFENCWLPAVMDDITWLDNQSYYKQWDTTQLFWIGFTS